MYTFNANDEGREKKKTVKKFPAVGLLHITHLMKAT